MNYKISINLIRWRVVNHPLTRTMTTTFALLYFHTEFSVAQYLRASRSEMQGSVVGFFIWMSKSGFPPKNKIPDLISSALWHSTTELQILHHDVLPFISYNYSVFHTWLQILNTQPFNFHEWPRQNFSSQLSTHYQPNSR